MAAVQPPMNMQPPKQQQMTPGQVQQPAQFQQPQPQQQQPPRANLVPLYVGDLAPSIAENQLYDIFCQIGPVISMRICRDTNTRKSLGYGYVNYQNQEDAERAIEQLNFEPINGKPIRIMYSQRDPTLRRSGVGNIFINHLDKKITNKDIFDTFSAFGTILSCKVAQDENGISKGYCFIHFENQDAADRAIAALNGKKFNGTKVSVAKFIPKAERDKFKENKPKVFNNCYVKPLSADVDDEKLKEIFQKYGEIISAKVMRDENGTSKGFGFVSFTRPEDAHKACDEMHGALQENNDKPWYVQRAMKKSERENQLKKKKEDWKREKNTQATNLYVKNIEQSITEDLLKEMFEKYGTVKSCKIMKFDNGVTKGYGFVNFEDPTAADNARQGMNGYTVKDIPLYVAQAMRKDEREAFLSNYWNTISSLYKYMPNNPFFNNLLWQQLIMMMNSGNPRMPVLPQQQFQMPGNMPRPPMMQGMPRPPQMYHKHQMHQQQPQAPMRARNHMQHQMNGHPQNHQHQQQPQQQHQQQQQILQNRNVNKTYPDSNMMGARGDEPKPSYSSIASAPNPQPAPIRHAPVAIPRTADNTNKYEKTLANLVANDPVKGKEMLGEQLYPKVMEITQNDVYASKVTGMLLQSIDVQDILVFLQEDGNDVFKSKVHEGLQMLQESEKQ